MKEIKRGQVYPNNITKSRLLEIYLSYEDFNCTPDDYRMDISLARIGESTGEKICNWYKDVDGKKIAELSLKDPNIRIEITNEGFKRIPLFSNRLKSAKKSRAKTFEDFMRIFTPHCEVSNPLKFIGRVKEIRQILNYLNGSGSIFCILGDRSTGKTSLGKMIDKICRGDNQLVEYYGLSMLLSRKFDSIFINAGVDAPNLKTLLKILNLRFNPEFDNGTETSSETQLGLKVISHKIVSKKIKNTTDLLDENHLLTCMQSKDIKVLLVLDEFDYFQDIKSIAPFLRQLVSQGNSVCLIGSDNFLDPLISGHGSIARSIIPIKLEPLGENEYKEMYYLANELGQECVCFEPEAIDFAYKISSGLPFYGQFIGFQTISAIFGDQKEFNEFISTKGTLEVKKVSRDSIESIVKDLKITLNHFEICYRNLAILLPQGEAFLNTLAKFDSIDIPEMSNLLNDNFSPEEIIGRLNSSLLSTQYIQVEGIQVGFSDPTFRQYIRITRELID